MVRDGSIDSPAAFLWSYSNTLQVLLRMSITVLLLIKLIKLCVLKLGTAPVLACLCYVVIVFFLLLFCVSSFNMDEFKRTYSNKDTETVAIPYLWEHFNKEDYSVWLAEYQYNEELGKIFMACNLVRGMFQRIEKLHKTAFASVGVFGKDGDVSISGIWIFRTQELAFTVGVKLPGGTFFPTTNLLFVLLYVA